MLAQLAKRQVQQLSVLKSGLALVTEADLVACTNWTMLTEMDGILDGLTALVPAGTATRFFIDLADPEKRSREDVAGVLRRIAALDKRAR